MADNDNSTKQKIGTPKSKDAYRQAWNAAMADRKAERPIASEMMKSPELVRALEHMLECTGDPVFSDALAAVVAYRFDQLGLKRGGNRAETEVFGDIMQGYLVQIRFNVERRGWTVPVSTQEVVSTFKVSGQSFETTTHELARKYRAWVHAGYPEPAIENAGDLGYTWIVFPAGDKPLDLGPVVVPLEGLTVKATNFWRRLLRDGDIKVRRVP